MSAVTTTTASELREAFKLFDADDNGEVTVAELNKYAQRNKHCKFTSHDHQNSWSSKSPFFLYQHHGTEILSYRRKMQKSGANSTIAEKSTEHS